jgi:hypothetical protein
MYIKIATLIVLVVLFLQDWNDRKVYWLLFPVLVLLLIGKRLFDQEQFNEVMENSVYSLGFVSIQLILLTGWFSFKYRRWIMVTTGLIGWGDIWLLLSLCFYLSIYHYIFFYLGSLLLITLGWPLWQFMSGNKTKFIPFAGLQALLFGLLLLMEWTGILSLDNVKWVNNFLG